MNRFFEVFEIPKIEYREPGRAVDDDGEVCEWYIDYDYPSIEPVFFDLVNLYNVHYTGREVNCPLIETNLKKCIMQSLLDLNDVLDDDLKAELKRDIQDIFKDYNGGKICE